MADFEKNATPFDQAMQDIDPTEIPFIFKNKELTKPANALCHRWMTHFIYHDQEVLRFLFNRTQLYCKHKGANPTSWAKWVNRCERELRLNKIKEF